MGHNYDSYLIDRSNMKSPKLQMFTLEDGTVIDPARKGWYRKYLTSAYFRDKEQSFLKYYDEKYGRRTCIHCRRSGGTAELLVRHFSKNEVGKETPQNLMLICADCYQAVARNTCLQRQLLRNLD